MGLWWGQWGLSTMCLRGCELKEGHHWLRRSKSDMVRDMGSTEHMAPAGFITPV